MDQIKDFFNFVIIKNDNITNKFFEELFNQLNFIYNGINLATSNRTIEILIKYFDSEMLKLLIEVNNILINPFYKINKNNLLLFNQEFSDCILNYYYIYSINKILNEIFTNCVDNDFINYYNKISCLKINEGTINYFHNIKICENNYINIYNSLINYYNINIKKIIIIDDYINYKTISKVLKIKIWDTYIGENERTGNCFCCKKKNIKVEHFEAGHVIAKSKGGKNTLENLRPICSLCNKSMGNKNMKEFIKSLT